MFCPLTLKKIAVESVTHMITIEYNDDGCDDERKLHVFVFECDITITRGGQNFRKKLRLISKKFNGFLFENNFFAFNHMAPHSLRNGLFLFQEAAYG